MNFPSTDTMEKDERANLARVLIPIVWFYHPGCET